MGFSKETGPGMPVSVTDIVARTAWGEARGEGILGMQAVINTFANRAARPAWWGHALDQVCLMMNDKGVHQYSCWNKSDPNRTALLSVTMNDRQFVQAVDLAQALMLNKLPDITKGADSYYDARSGEKPQWAQSRFYRCKIGNHAFYRVGPFGEG